MASRARTVLRFAARGVAALVAVLLLAVGVLAFTGGQRLGRVYDAPAHAVPVATAPADIEEGGRLAAYWGCVGCHERDAGGQVLFQSPFGDRLVAPNLTALVRDYDVAELERAIRHGVRRNGASLVVMPSSMYANVSDEDLGKVIGYLRSLPAVPDTLPPTRLGLLARYIVLTEGEDVLEASQAGSALHGAGPDSVGPASTRADTLALGRYLAMTGCPECHGPDLRGRGDTPDLRIAAAYPLDRFLRFIEDGTALDGQDKGLMSQIARGRIGRLTAAEVAALHTFLRTLAD